MTFPRWWVRLWQAKREFRKLLEYIRRKVNER